MLTTTTVTAAAAAVAAIVMRPGMSTVVPTSLHQDDHHNKNGIRNSKEEPETDTKWQKQCLLKGSQAFCKSTNNHFKNNRSNSNSSITKNNNNNGIAIRTLKMKVSVILNTMGTSRRHLEHLHRYWYY